MTGQRRNDHVERVVSLAVMGDRVGQRADDAEVHNPAYRAEIRAWTSDDPRRLEERQQRAKASFIVLLISSDQSANRQIASPRPRIQAILSNRFHASSKMVNCRLP